jgi:hypothetical protein
MSRWIVLAIAILVIVISSILRGARQQQQQNPWRRVLKDPDEDRPPRRPPPPLPKRRQPPPVARARSVVFAEAVEPPIPTAVPVATPVPGPAEKMPVSPAGAQVMALLKHRQTLRTAMMLREILEPPLSRRRRLR